MAYLRTYRAKMLLAAVIASILFAARGTFNSEDRIEEPPEDCFRDILQNDLMEYVCRPKDDPKGFIQCAVTNFGKAKLFPFMVNLWQTYFIPNIELWCASEVPRGWSVLDYDERLGKGKRNARIQRNSYWYIITFTKEEAKRIENEPEVF